MLHKPKIVGKVTWLLLLLLAALAATGCGARSGAGETVAAAPPAPFDPSLLLDLPALVITYDAQGVPSLGGTPLSQLPALTPPALLSQLTLNPATITQLAQAGVQTVQMSNTPTGLRILVNDQPLPTLVWDQNSLSNLLALLEPLTGSGGAWGKLVATVTNVGIGLAVHFPPINAEPSSLSLQDDQADAQLALASEQVAQERLSVSPVMQIPVIYSADGAWTVQGISDTQWQALTGLPFGYLRLNPDLVQGAAASGINQVTLWTDSDGIHLTVGEQELPYLSWSGGGFSTLLSLLVRFGLVTLDSTEQADAYQLLQTQLLPVLQSVDLRITVRFPAE